MSSKTNIVNDIGVLTKVPNKVLEALIDKVNLCIGSIIVDAQKSGEQNVVINIGIGSLSVSLADMQCKFVPSKALKTTIKECLTGGAADPLELELEAALSSKLIAICDEVL
jgi:hypothetical protein